MEREIPKDGVLDTRGEWSNEEKHQVEIHQLIEKLIDCPGSQKEKGLHSADEGGKCTRNSKATNFVLCRKHKSIWLNDVSKSHAKLGQGRDNSWHTKSSISIRFGSCS